MLHTIKAAMRAVQPLRLVLINSRRRSRRNRRALALLRAKDTQLTYLFRESSDQLEEMIGDLSACGGTDEPPADALAVHVAPGFDPQYRPMPIQKYLNDTLDAALLRARHRLGASRDSAATDCLAARRPPASPVESNPIDAATQR